MVVGLLLGESSKLPEDKRPMEHPGSNDDWGRFVGQPATQVCDAIKESNPELKVVTAIPFDSPVTADYRLDRVRVFHDKDGNVVRKPKKG